MRKFVMLVLVVFISGVAQADTIVDQLYAGFVGHAKFAYETTTDGEARPGFHVNYVEIGKLHGMHIAAIDASADGVILEDKFESVHWSLGAKLHLSPFIKTYVNLPVGWDFLNAMEIDGRYSYDFTNHHPVLGLVAAYPFK